MPLLDIAIAQSSIQNYWARCRVQSFIFGTVPHHVLLQHDRWASLRKPFHNTGNLNLYLGHFSRRSHKEFLVKAVATLEPTPFVKSKDEKKQSSAFSSTAEQPNDSEEIDERERLRRIRISKANKGNTPWNKGRKHSPETLQRIRERTKLAMQDPKVKMKLANIGHAQSAETRKKIAVGVRIGWQRRREKLLLQETCLFDWQNLIAEAGRQGFQEEEELQWDSYKIMNEQLQQEWLASIELRKTTPRPKGSKRAPKSLEQRKKIADAIAAKWADPEYRARVCTGLAKYHGIPEGAERKVRKKSSDGSQSQSPRTPKKKVNSTKVSAATEYKAKPQQPKLKKRTPPKYKDPLANSKLEMLKSIRAQRVASKPRKNEAFERAKLLIAEAEKAAKALEVAAIRSPVARASLLEAKNLIAEAIQSIESIEKRDFTAENHLTLGPQNHADTDEISVTDHVNDRNSRDVNGINPFAPTTDSRIPDISIYGMPILEEIGVNHKLPRQISGFEFRKHNTKSFVGKSEFREQTDHPHLHGLNGATRLNGLSSEDHITEQQNHEEQIPNGSAKSRTRKWISGRLVEVVEDE